MTTPGPIENPQLVAAMDTMAKIPTPENEAVLIAELKQARFLAPIRPSSMPPSADAAFERMAIQFEMLVDTYQNSWFPAFTDNDEVSKWKHAPDQQGLALTLDNYLDILENNPAEQTGVVINPYHHNLQLTRRELYRITGKVMPYTMREGTHIALASPANWPRELADALDAHLRTQPTVRAAWLQTMTRKKEGSALVVAEGEKEESYLLIVDHDGDRRELFDSIGEAAKPHLGIGEYLDILPATEQVVLSVIQNVPPFYTKRG